MSEVLRRHGAWGCSAQQLPSSVFMLRRPRLARLLSRLFATDATSWTATSGSVRIGDVTVSERLADQVRHVLLRFGIRTGLRAHTGRATYEIEIVDPPSVLRFIDEIGTVGRDEAVARVRLCAASASRRSGRRLRPDGGVGRRAQGQGRAFPDRGHDGAVDRAGHDWHARAGGLRRETLAELATALDSDQLRWWASADVDGIDRRIEAAGETRVVDFTVPQLHNFVAADVYLHNTAFGLGMATHVAQTTGRPVLVFSLEMGHNELTQRILASEAKSTR